MPLGVRVASQKVQRLRARLADDKRIRQAAAAYREKQALGLAISIMDHARKSGVPYGKLYNYLLGRPLRSDVDAAKCHLTPAESEQLVNWLVSQADRGFPLTDAQIEDLANYLIRKVRNMSTDWSGVGQDWVYRFRIRHEDRLARYWTRSLTSTRANGLSPEHVERWFELLAKTILNGAVPPSRIFAMDESGFLISVLMRQMVTGGKTADSHVKKIQHSQSSHNRELVTVIATICADGTALTPAVIFQGKNMMRNWVKENPLHAHVGMSAKGYNNGVISLAWIQQLDRDTRHKAPNGEKRVVIVDGHASHYTAEALEYARDHNIEILAYPPHTTHALQGLDVAIFGPLKQAYSAAVLKFERESGEFATKARFLTLFEQPWRQTVTPELVREAFRKTGVWPVNGTVIRPEQMAPAVANSIHPGFGLTTPSPVRAVMVALVPTSQPTRATALPVPLPAPGEIPVTPRRSPPGRHVIPTDQANQARDLLRQTSAAFVLGDTVSPSDQLPSPVAREPAVSSPDWSMAEPSPGDSRQLAAVKAELRKARRRNASQKHLVQSAQAMMVLQGRHLQLLSKRLAARQKKRKDIQSVLFKSGNGVLLTNEASIALIREAQERRIAAQTRRDKRKADRDAARVAKEAEKTRKRLVREQYHKDLHAWEEACAAIRRANPNKRRNLGLPEKPRNPLYIRRKKAGDVSESESEEEDDVEMEEEESDVDAGDESDSDAMDIDLVHTDDDDVDWEDE